MSSNPLMDYGGGDLLLAGRMAGCRFTVQACVCTVQALGDDLKRPGSVSVTKSALGVTVCDTRRAIQIDLTLPYLRATMHNVTDKQTDRRTDGQTDDMMMPTADHTVQQYDPLQFRG